MPRCGVWTLSGEAATDTLIQGPVTIVDTDAARTLIGTVRTSRVDGARCVFDVVGGFGGWSKTVPALGYHNDAGVKKALVLADAARAVGETIVALPVGLLDNHYARRNGPASAVMHDVCPDGWRVNDAGLTDVTPIAPYTYAVESSVVTQPDVAGCLSIASDTLADLRPGLRYNGVVYGDIEVVISASKITTTAYSLIDSTSIIARLVTAVSTRLRYSGVSTYLVASAGPDRRVNLQPVNKASLLPQLARVPCHAIAGVRGTPVPGSKVLVMFADGLPTRPVIIAGDDIAGTGWGGDVEIGAAAGTFDDAAKATPLAQSLARIIADTAAMVGSLSADAPSATAAAADYLAGFAGDPLPDHAASNVRIS